MDQKKLNYLRSPKTIRNHCHQILGHCINGESLYFTYHPTQLKPLSSYVIDVIKKNYPDLEIPYHSRWHHFNTKDPHRLESFYQKLASKSIEEKGIILFDLVVVSVLLDAGSGSQWKYLDQVSGHTLSKSEGLAVSSLRMFETGFFSSDPDDPLRVDSLRLKKISQKELEQQFQISATNSLESLEKRLMLLKSLGAIIEANPIFSFKNSMSRPGVLFSCFLNEAKKNHMKLEAPFMLATLLETFSDIWPDGLLLEGHNLGDVGRHSQVKGLYHTDTLVPFHKLSQWLCYSLFEPLEEAHVTIQNINQLTALPEYRNGGLLIDFGLIGLKDHDLYKKTHDPQSELIVEWRALTVSLIDLLAEEMRKTLKLNEDELSLAKVLEGGTWSAGRKIAQEKRQDSSPPLKINLSGTIF